MKHLHTFVQKTDWKLLTEQKQELIDLGLDGMVNFLDAFQDAVVDDQLVDENVVFQGTLFPNEN